MVKITGQGAGKAFSQESGQHIVQRVPPTEKRGRRQTSVVGVAVLPLPPERLLKLLPENELEIVTQTGHGKGGQHQNKTASAVRMLHKPTGLRVFINGRDQHANRREALRILSARVNEHRNSQNRNAYSNDRKLQLGDGNRGGKIRTYNFINSLVTDHRTGKKTRNIEGVMRGKFELLK